MLPRFEMPKLSERQICKLESFKGENCSTVPESLVVYSREVAVLFKLLLPCRFHLCIQGKISLLNNRGKVIVFIFFFVFFLKDSFFRAPESICPRATMQLSIEMSLSDQTQEYSKKRSPI